MASDQLYNELVNEFHKNYIFFIPSKIVLNELINKPELTKLKHLFDRVLAIDNTFQVVPIEELNSYIYIMGKADLLDKNIFKLLDKKGEAPDIQFNFILEKYYQQVEFYYQTSEFYLSNLSLPIFDNINDTIKGLFTIQHNNYKKHLEGLNEQFYPDKTINSQVEIDFTKHLGNIIPEDKELSNEFEIKVKDINEPKFSDYIKHDRNIFIVNTIVENYKVEKGKTLRYIIEYFITREIVSMGYGKKQKLYDALKNSFNRDIGAYNSIWAFKLDKIEDKDYKTLKTEIKKLFPPGLF